MSERMREIELSSIRTSMVDARLIRTLSYSRAGCLLRRRGVKSSCEVHLFKHLIDYIPMIVSVSQSVSQ